MKTTTISDRGLIRLLPATYHKPPALRGLVDTDEEAEILAEIEGLTSARLVAEAAGAVEDAGGGDGGDAGAPGHVADGGHERLTPMDR